MDYSPLLLSCKLAGISTFFLLLIGAPLAYALVFIPMRGKLFIESLIGLPLVLPPTVFGFYLLLLMGEQGSIGRLYKILFDTSLLFTFAGIAIAAILHTVPYVIQPLKASFSRIDRRLLESAEVLGCSKMSCFFRVVLPNSLPGLAAAAILSFAHIMGQFGVILMIGGSIPDETRVASIAIFEYVEAMRYQEAGQLSLALLVVSYLILLTVNILEKKNNEP
ncbi:molybdate ABC transporter permease subunit [Desulfotalea psychrophila]|uniref:Molybdenum transport system permease n=1 Tax=Desulfotalea psychrophila TaxID=84980 RepID=A0ABS3AVZ8_9BACT|nr:molybdate ABC transporter permease subunit [Desulfotalea psychrophila]